MRTERKGDRGGNHRSTCAENERKIKKEIVGGEKTPEKRETRILKSKIRQHQKKTIKPEPSWARKVADLLEGERGKTGRINLGKKKKPTKEKKNASLDRGGGASGDGGLSQREVGYESLTNSPFLGTNFNEGRGKERGSKERKI